MGSIVWSLLWVNAGLIPSTVLHRGTKTPKLRNGLESLGSGLRYQGLFATLNPKPELGRVLR